MSPIVSNAAKKVMRIFNVKSENDTAQLAENLALYLRSGDTVTLSGDLGTGKTTIARSIIHSITGESQSKIASPTFLLLQEYKGASVTVIHADLYRLNAPGELDEVGFDELSLDTIKIVEWPERYPPLIETAKVNINIQLLDVGNPCSRTISITSEKELLRALELNINIQKFLSNYKWDDAVHEIIVGDASGRRFERLRKNFSSVILMIAPPIDSETMIRDTQSYKSIAKLAVSIKPFIAVANGLTHSGLSAPKILGYDIENGLLLSEDLGIEVIFDGDKPIIERYRQAVGFIGNLHRRDLPRRIPICGDTLYEIPRYDIDALLIEVELFIDWYLPDSTQNIVSNDERANFLDIWRKLLEPLQGEPHGWTLRDFHSPNILWLSDRSGVAKIGVIDIQDTVWGHRAYDLASLLQDARIFVTRELEVELYELYIHLRTEEDNNFDVISFSKSYSVYALQRVTKVLGIFVRLAKRDGKTDYLKYIPNLVSYLRRNLLSSALSEYREWIRINSPELLYDDLGNRQFS